MYENYVTKLVPSNFNKAIVDSRRTYESLPLRTSRRVKYLLLRPRTSVMAIFYKRPTLNGSSRPIEFILRALFSLNEFSSITKFNYSAHLSHITELQYTFFACTPSSFEGLRMTRWWDQPRKIRSNLNSRWGHYRHRFVFAHFCTEERQVEIPVHLYGKCETIKFYWRALLAEAESRLRNVYIMKSFYFCLRDIIVLVIVWRKLDGNCGHFGGNSAFMDFLWVVME